MSSVINLLDEATRNKIAAGEVVERPASCVKELVENAIDAGATSIEVEIASGGAAYIRVTDNGSGMSAEDARKCIIRHATSKISKVEDIFAITSLGFRGEAVPSIAAVSHFQITTRRPDDDFATHLVLEGGEVKEDEQIGAAVGTTMEVRDLFYNTPARRKFLKSERTESSRISEMLTKLALAEPAIAFTFINNGRTTMRSGGSGKLKETIADLYGAQLTREIFPVTYDHDDIVIEGYAGKPSVLKSSRAWQTCLVNQRIIHNPLLFKAIDNAYHAMLPKSGYPFAVLHLHVDPASIDVNVHPSKTEIKFADEQEIYRAVYHSIVTALLEQEKPEQIAAPVTHYQAPKAVVNETPVAPAAGEQHEPLPGVTDTVRPAGQAIIRETAGTGWPDTPAASPVAAVERPAAVEPILTNETQPVHQETTLFPASRGSASQRPAVPPLPDLHRPPAAEEKERFSQALYQNGAATPAPIGTEPKAEGETEQPLPQIVFDGDADVFIPLGEVADCFIVAKKGQDLYLIDQHAAHERIRYDTFCRRTEDMPSQQLLTPEFVDVDEDDMTLLQEREEVFQDLGYGYSVAGPKTLRVDEVPCDLETSDIADSLQDICRLLRENNVADKATLRHRSLAYLSCHGAVKAGDTLNIRQMKQLLDDLFHTETPYVCPHGRPIIVRFTPSDLARLFKRT